MKKFILTMLVVLIAQPVYAATLYLGIGVNAKVKSNDDYAPEINILHKIIKPAQYKHILGSDVTKDNVTKGFEWLLNTATDQDINIVYISAHGHYDDKAKYNFSGYNWESIKGEMVAKYLNFTRGNTILIVDTCHSGGILEEKWLNNNIAILAACDKNSSSYGRYFCEKLYEALKQHNSAVDIERYITRNITNSQTPTYKNSKNVVLTTTETTVVSVSKPLQPIRWQYGD